jgi:hypothetical protein
LIKVNEITTAKKAAIFIIGHGINKVAEINKVKIKSGLSQSLTD